MHLIEEPVCGLNALHAAPSRAHQDPMDFQKAHIVLFLLNPNQLQVHTMHQPIISPPSSSSSKEDKPSLLSSPLKISTMATSSYLLHHVHVKGWQSQISKNDAFTLSERLKCPTRRIARQSPRVSSSSAKIELLTSNVPSGHHIMPSDITSDIVHSFLLADLDPATAKLAISILGPFLSAFGFLFVLRIVMSWYPKLPVEKFPFVLAYAPTEPFLAATRKVIQPLAGVDVTPVVWFGLISFLNEILVGPQGLIVLLSQQVN